MIILGSGYVGLALARAALAAGEPVAALTRNAARAAELHALGVSPVIVADLAGSDWHTALDPAGADIVNCVSPSSSSVEGYRHSFLAGHASIRTWLEKSLDKSGRPARSLVFTSSTAVYPQTDGSWVDENTAVEPASLGQGGAVLREAEAHWLSLSPQLAQRSFVLRLAGIYGPERHHLLDALRAGEKSFPGGGDHWVNLIYRDDIVSAIRTCLNSPLEIEGGIFNVADNEPVLKKDLVAWLAQRLGQNPADLHFDEVVQSRATHRRTASGQVPNRRISSARLQNRAGWSLQCRSFREGYKSILG